MEHGTAIVINEEGNPEHIASEDTILQHVKPVKAEIYVHKAKAI
jgi:hypothetical protein